MNKQFTYSVLQYKHSLILGESLNVGILFYFPIENRFEFVKGDGTRAKSIYPDFDNSTFNAYIKAITNKVKEHVDLFNELENTSDFSKYIHQNILAIDAAGLVFKEPVSTTTDIIDLKQIIIEYSRLLLPGINVEKPVIFKHNENFIIKTFSGYLLGKNKDIEKRLKKNEVVRTKHFSIKFEYSFKNERTNFIKPISFDLNDEISIQNKSAILYSQLVDLKEYIKYSPSKFDILIAKPQNGFRKEFENALDLIDSVKIPKQLVLDEGWNKYSEETLNLLSE
jgi:hypothetical protein